MNGSHEITEQADINPDILEAHWDMEQVDNLFEDLQQGAKVQHVQVRTTSGGATKDLAVTLGEALSLLHRGEAKAIQVRYEFDDQSWCDTLMSDSMDVRIIRTRL